MVEQFDYNLSSPTLCSVQHVLRCKLSSDDYVFDTRSINEGVFNIVKKSDFGPSTPKPVRGLSDTSKIVSFMLPLLPGTFMGCLMNTSLVTIALTGGDISSIAHHWESIPGSLYPRCITTVMYDTPKEDDESQDDIEEDAPAVPSEDDLSNNEAATVTIEQNDPEKLAVGTIHEPKKKSMTALALFEDVQRWMEDSIIDYTLVTTMGFSESLLASEWSHYAKACLSLVDPADRQGVIILPEVRQKWLDANAVSIDLFNFLQVATNKNMVLSKSLATILVSIIDDQEALEIMLNPSSQVDASLAKVIEETHYLFKKFGSKG